MSVNLLTPYEMMIQIAKKAKGKRLELNLSQKTVADRSGVSLGVLKKFERMGKISLESLLKLALILESLGDFSGIFHPKELESYPSLDRLLKKKTRKRGRK